MGYDVGLNGARVKIEVYTVRYGSRSQQTVYVMHSSR